MSWAALSVDKLFGYCTRAALPKAERWQKCFLGLLQWQVSPGMLLTCSWEGGLQRWTSRWMLLVCVNIYSALVFRQELVWQNIPWLIKALMNALTWLSLLGLQVKFAYCCSVIINLTLTMKGIIKSCNILSWKGPTRIIESSSWLHAVPPWNQTTYKSIVQILLDSSRLSAWPLPWGAWPPSWWRTSSRFFLVKNHAAWTSPGTSPCCSLDSYWLVTRQKRSTPSAQTSLCGWCSRVPVRDWMSTYKQCHRERKSSLNCEKQSESWMSMEMQVLYFLEYTHLRISDPADPTYSWKWGAMLLCWIPWRMSLTSEGWSFPQAQCEIRISRNYFFVIKRISVICQHRNCWLYVCQVEQL